jgi:hypothetical protein
MSAVITASGACKIKVRVLDRAYEMVFMNG